MRVKTDLQMQRCQSYVSAVEKFGEIIKKINRKFYLT